MGDLFDYEHLDARPTDEAPPPRGRRQPDHRPPKPRRREPRPKTRPGTWLAAGGMLLLMLAKIIAAVSPPGDATPAPSAVSSPHAPSAPSAPASDAPRPLAAATGEDVEVVWYDPLDPAQTLLVTRLEQLGPELGRELDALEREEEEVNADEVWLTNSARVIHGWERKMDTWTALYPDGFPPAVVGDAQRLLPRYEDAIQAHNARVASARERQEAYQAHAQRLQQMSDEYEQRWDRLVQLTASLPKNRALRSEAPRPPG